MLKVGDVVIVKSGFSEIPAALRSAVGIVRQVATANNHTGIEFQHDFSDGHNLNGVIDKLRGYYINSMNLEKMMLVAEVIRNVFFEAQFGAKAG